MRIFQNKKIRLYSRIKITEKILQQTEKNVMAVKTVVASFSKSRGTSNTQSDGFCHKKINNFL